MVVKKPELAPTAGDIAQQAQEPEVEPTEDQPLEEPKDETDS